MFGNNKLYEARIKELKDRITEINKDKAYLEGLVKELTDKLMILSEKHQENNERKMFDYSKEVLEQNPEARKISSGKLKQMGDAILSVAEDI